MVVVAAEEAVAVAAMEGAAVRERSGRAVPAVPRLAAAGGAPPAGHARRWRRCRRRPSEGRRAAPAEVRRGLLGLSASAGVYGRCAP